MSCAFGWALQQALFTALTADPDVQALAGGRVWDEAPHDAARTGGAWLTLGDETVEAWGSDGGAAHVVRIAAFSDATGFGALKRLVAAAEAAALGPLDLGAGRIVTARFLSARTGRMEAAGLRRVELRLRFVIEP